MLMDMNIYSGDCKKFLGKCEFDGGDYAALVLAQKWVADQSFDCVKVEPTGHGDSVFIVGEWMTYAGRDDLGEKLYVPLHDAPVLFLTPVRE